MATRLNDLIVDGQVIKVTNDDILVNGISITEKIKDAVIGEAKFIKKFHKEIRAQGSEVHNKLAEKFSFHEQLEAIFSAFEGDNGKLNKILEVLKTIKREE